MPAYTWTTGETITAAKLQALEDEAWRISNQIASSSSTTNSSTNSTSFVDAAASVTFTAKNSSVYIQISGGGIAAQLNGTAIAGININGTDYEVCHHFDADGANGRSPYCGGVLVSGLTPGVSYTAKTRLRTDNASYTAYLNAYLGVTSTRQTITVWDIGK